MKKNIKETPKSDSPAKKDTRAHTAKKSGYKEDVFNGEEQADYEKSHISKDNKRNTTGPAS